MFTQALTTVYPLAPCRVLPNALWKTLRQARALEGAADARFEVACDAVGRIARLAMRDDRGLYVYWTRDRTAGPGPAWLAGVELALLHADYLDHVDLGARDLIPRQAYFRLRHDPATDTSPAPLPAGYDLRPVETGDSDQLDAVADLIDRCYPHLQPSPETVAAWTHHPAFDADLWLWVWDRAADRPAGLGIAELDPTVGEGSLEWIQMLPDYRSRGLGRALVAALLARLGDAAFVTVSGEVHASGQPERFYRRCGFRGDDVWWVVRTRNVGTFERLDVTGSWSRKRRHKLGPRGSIPYPGRLIE